MTLIRSALRLAAAGGTRATPHDLPQLARFLQRTLLARSATSTLAGRALSRAYKSAVCEYRRSYATTAKATTPTATTKKKKAANATPTKKKNSKKTVARGKEAGRPKSTKKAVAKKAGKKPAKKAAPKTKRAKLKLTPEQKKSAQIKELKKRALSPPPVQSRALNVYVAEQTKGSTGSPEVVQNRFLELTKKFKSITPAERERYNQLALERTAARKAEYQLWLHSYTPEQIRDANKARLHLRRIAKANGGKAPKNTVKLVDDRAPPRAISAYFLFSNERRQSGDFKELRIVETAKLLGEEWKAMSEGQKKKYRDQAATDSERYKREISA